MKNKEITLHELMGLMKDGKAPKKIKLQDTIYEYDKNINGYFDKNGYNLFYLVMSKYILDSKIEILSEENNEWEDIEEIDIENDGHNDFIKNEHGTKCGLTKHSKIIAEKVNKLIKNQKYLKAMVESLQRPFTDEIRVDIPKWIVDPKKERLESKDV